MAGNGVNRGKEELGQSLEFVFSQLYIGRTNCMVCISLHCLLNPAPKSVLQCTAFKTH